MRLEVERDPGQPKTCKAFALPIELLPLVYYSQINLAGSEGIEVVCDPSTTQGFVNL